jgi:predicted nucleic acid-binding protein
LIDSNVWIEFLRRPEEPIGKSLYALLAASEAGVVGIVVAEVLQGPRSAEDYEKLRRGFDAAEFVEMDRSVWERAGQLSMQLKLAGTPVALRDLAIAATAIDRQYEVFTLDGDFERIPGLRLYKPEGGADA